jgi:hypothetical protein
MHIVYPRGRKTVLSVYLRQRGSRESRLVGALHYAAGVGG